MKFWDLLFKRYASPLVLIENMLQMNSFSSFVTNLIKTYYEEQEEDKMWSMYLYSHAFYEKSFNEFKNSFYKNDDIEIMEEQDLKATIQESFNTLNGFNPS